MNTTTPSVHIDPLLGDVFELLHRMTVCREDTPATRYAGEALKKLRQYEDCVRSARASGSK
ncbi:hypothetical protein QZN30_17660 [Burkholderia multivorans]|nr:hypothetical protein [Burkholderia multivorans]